VAKKFPELWLEAESLAAHLKFVFKFWFHNVAAHDPNLQGWTAFVPVLDVT
jgi:hypothetical protein